MSNRRSAIAIGALVLALALLASASLAASGALAHKPRVVCIAADGSHWRSPSRPHRCVFHERKKPFDSADEAPITGLRWSAWGQHKALGNGTFVGNMGFRAHVRVKLTKPRHGWPNRRLYFSHLKFSGKEVNGTMHLDVPHSSHLPE